MFNPIQYDETTGVYTIWLSFFGIKHMRHFNTQSEALEFINDNPTRLLSGFDYEFNIEPERPSSIQFDLETNNELLTNRIGLLEKFKQTTRIARLLIVSPIFWTASVILFVLFFEPYGYMSSDDYVHLFKILIFPPILIILAYYLYTKVISPVSSRK